MTSLPSFPMDATDKAFLSRHLARSSAHGEPLGPGLRLAAAAGMRSGTCALHCTLLAERLEAGESLSSALAAFPKSFRADEVALVAAGEEAGGDSREALAAWAALADERRKGGRAAREALMYPLLVVGLAACLVAVVLWKVIPTFAAIQMEAGREFPATTRAAIILTHLVVDGAMWAPLVLLALLAASFLLRRVGAEPWLHRFHIAIPLVGRSIRGRARCVTLALVAAFVRAGRGLPEALRHAAAAQPNRWIARELESLARRLDAGEPLPLEAVGGLERSTMHALRAALASRDPTAAVAGLASTESRAVARRQARFESIAPSLLIIGLGLLLGIILVGLYSLTFSMPALIP